MIKILTEADNQKRRRGGKAQAALKQLLESQSNEETKPLVLTTQQVAAELQVSIPTMRDHFLCRPDFPKIRAGSKYLIPRKAFEEWLNGQS